MLETSDIGKVCASFKMQDARYCKGSPLFILPKSFQKIMANVPERGQKLPEINGINPEKTASSNV